MAKPLKKNKVVIEDFVRRVVTGSEERLEKRIDELDKKQEKRFNKVMEHLADIAGKFKKFDEEQTVLSGRVIEHDDRIEKLEKVVFKSS